MTPDDLIELYDQLRRRCPGARRSETVSATRSRGGPGWRIQSHGAEIRRLVAPAVGCFPDFAARLLPALCCWNSLGARYYRAATWRLVMEGDSEFVTIPWSMKPSGVDYLNPSLSKEQIELVLARLRAAGIPARHELLESPLQDWDGTVVYFEYTDVFHVPKFQKAAARSILKTVVPAPRKRRRGQE